MDIRDIRTDSTMVEQGVWVKFDSETSFLIASTASTAFRQALRKYRKPYEGAISIKGSNALTPEQYESMQQEAEADTVLLDWNGLKIDGDLTVYSRDLALQLLRTVPVLRNWVLEQANKVDNFRKAVLEADAKNSESVSAGEKSGVSAAVEAQPTPSS